MQVFPSGRAVYKYTPPINQTVTAGVCLEPGGMSQSALAVLADGLLFGCAAIETAALEGLPPQHEHEC
jgi:hypothetical protein